MRSDRCRRAALALVSAMALGIPLGSAAAQGPERHGKSIKQCNDELKADAAALAKAGESPADFFHDCWWRTAAGHATQIRGVAASGPPSGSEHAGDTMQADAALAKARQETATARSEAAAAMAASKVAQARAAAAEAAVKAQAASEARARADASKAAVAAEAKTPATAAPPRHVARIRRPSLAPRRSAIARPFVVPSAQRHRLFAAAARPLPTPAATPASPPIVMVPVQIPGLGLKRPIAWPVFPAYVPAFRSVVNNPIVPGFTRTP